MRLLFLVKSINFNVVPSVGNFHVGQGLTYRPFLQTDLCIRSPSSVFSEDEEDEASRKFPFLSLHFANAMISL